MTNADRIRNKTNEELAELFRVNIDCQFCPLMWNCHENCKETLLEWLNQEAEETEA